MQIEKIIIKYNNNIVLRRIIFAIMMINLISSTDIEMYIIFSTKVPMQLINYTWDKTLKL